METVSTRLIGKYMFNKAKPFLTEEWCEIVLNATYILNKNYVIIIRKESLIGVEIIYTPTDVEIVEI